jgi:predicted ATP-dependent endonuclease of OLD family
MHIHNITVEHFRSAENVVLPTVGAFNVLIGKNNSGKSTVLLAIEGFFQCLRSEGIVTLEPTLGKRIDFNCQDTKRDISLTVIFKLLPEERLSLLDDIAIESPQLKALIASIEQSLFVEITVAIKAPRSGFAFIRSIRFGSNENPSANTWRDLLIVGNDSASEIATRQREIERLKHNETDLRRFSDSIDADDFARLKRETSENRSYLMYRLSSRRPFIGTSPQSLEMIESILRSAESPTDFKNAANSIAEQTISEARKIEGESLKVQVQTFSGEQSFIPKYALKLIERIASMKLLYLTERRDPVGRPEAKQLLDYKVTRGGPATLRDIQSKVERLLGVKIDAFENTSGSPGDRTAEMDVDDFLLEVNGSGVKEALRLILDAELKKPAILLVEEPEVHLHPALETNMMTYLRDISAYCQVFISTHSTNFLDTANTQNVYFVSKQAASSSTVKLLNVGDAEGELPEALGIRLSSLFMFDRLVFVEALSDELIFREFAEILDVNLSQTNVGFIHIGGARNFANYASESTFSFLSKRLVRSTFILDRDERSDEDVKKMAASLGERALLHVLKKRELENYLLNTRPLAQLINNKQKSAGVKNAVEATPESVQKEMMKSVEFLRTLTILKRSAKELLSSIHVEVEFTKDDLLPDAAAKISSEFQRLRDMLSTKEQQTTSTIDATSRQIANQWAQSWTVLVLGDELLDETCKAFGTRFRKTTDGPILAKLYTAAEIDPELTTLLRGLAT